MAGRLPYEIISSYVERTFSTLRRHARLSESRPNTARHHACAGFVRFSALFSGSGSSFGPEPHSGANERYAEAYFFLFALLSSALSRERFLLPSA